MSVVEVNGLRVELDDSGVDVVDEISFAIERGEVLGLVGESGSGKTTIALALLGDARPGARIAGGSIRVGDSDVLTLSPAALQAFRGRVVSYVPQDPAAALNPARRIGDQIAEVIDAHTQRASRSEANKRIAEVLAEVQLPGDKYFLRRFPHQLSGGQQQRVCLAIAFVLRPRVLVLDEPTTGLDVGTQAHVLSTVRTLCERHGVAALYVTHDLAVVANLAHRVMVLYAGRFAEVGPREVVFRNPAHPYTRKLLAAVPDVSGRRALEAISGTAPDPGARPSGCFFSPRCWAAVAECFEVAPETVEVSPDHFARCRRVSELEPYDHDGLAPGVATRDHADDDVILGVCELDAYYGPRQVLRDVSLQLLTNECLAIVGQSGSGKTTLARVIVGLHAAHSGRVELNGQPLEARARERSTDVRRSVQYIFQSPYNSLNPRRSIGDIVALPLMHFFRVSRREARKRAEQALVRVALSSKTALRRPGDLSGGERQRVAIARALVCEPSVLICDEITSALDVSIQAAIVEMLGRLQEEEALSMLFVTHNLALVRNIADRVLVLNEGLVVESGDTGAVLDRPDAAYTRWLVAQTPSITFAR